VDEAAGPLLEPVVADGVGRFDRGFHVSGFDEFEFLLTMVRPHAGQVVGLQLQPHGEVVFFHRLPSVHVAEEVLDMVPDLMGNDVGLGELALRPAELLFQLVEKGRVEIHLPVGRTVERADGRGRESATGSDLVAEQVEVRRRVRLAHLGELVLPNHLGGAEDLLGEDERLFIARGSVHRRVGRRSGPVAAKIDAEDQTEHQEHQRRSTSHGDLAAHPSAILDIAAFRGFV
jgi:hypothetical protein